MSSTRPENPISTSFATSRIVTLLVGPDQQPYTVHKDLLLKSCPFFESCLKVTFKESQEDRVEFPDDSPAAFDCLVDWIYRAKVMVCEHQNDIDLLAETFVLADKFCMSDFQNALVDSIRGYRRDRNLVPAPSTLAYISSNGPPDSKLKAFLLDQLIYDLMHFAKIYQGENWTSEVAELNEIMQSGGELASEIMWAMRSFHLKPFSGPMKRGRCHYHTHENEEDREKCEATDKSDK